MTDRGTAATKALVDQYGRLYERNTLSVSLRKKPE